MLIYLEKVVIKKKKKKTIKHSIFFLVERVRHVFQENHALPDTSVRLSEFVLWTFLVKNFSLAILDFSIFKIATGFFKMAAKWK